MPGWPVPPVGWQPWVARWPGHDRPGHRAGRDRPSGLDARSAARSDGSAGLVVDAAVGLGQGAAGAAPAELDQLGGDRDRRLLRGPGAQVEADRGPQASELRVRSPRPRAVAPAGPRASAATPWRRYTPAGVRSATSRTGTSNFGSWVRTVITVRGIHVNAGQEPVRPVHDHLVGLAEPGLGREDRPRVADGHVIAEELADPRHGGREVDRAEDVHPGRRRERVHEDAQLAAQPLAIRRRSGGCRSRPGPAGRANRRQPPRPGAASRGSPLSGRRPRSRVAPR